MNLSDANIILASASPRRKELLERTGLKFNIIKASGDEIIKSDIPSDVVKQLSFDKAKEIADKYKEDAVIIGADTIVVAEGRILGKPSDRQEAFDMISSIRNDYHSVFTGVSIICKVGSKSLVKSFASETKVYVYDMTDDEVYKYLDKGESMDKAGAYAIQGFFSEYIYSIHGDYNNVVGLPLARLMKELKEMLRGL